MTDRQLLAVIA
jgi:hypothetical protein